MSEQYGPNTAAVEAFLERLRTATADELEKLSTARNAARNAARATAWVTARDAAWVTAWGARATARATAWVTARDAAQDAAQDATAAAARDAALALVVQDLISEEHFEVLYGPWRKAMS